MEEITPEEIAQKIEERKLELAVKQEEEKNRKPITEISISDIKATVDPTKPLDVQAEQAVSAMVTAQAIKDDKVNSALTDEKATELVNKAKQKSKTAIKEAVMAETELQKAERDLYEAVLNTFGIYKHLPRGLMKFLVWILSPLYVIISLIIGLPIGVVKVVIDNLDGVVCRYEKVGDTVKPKMKVIFWVLLALIITGAICLTVLACLHII